MKTGILKHLFQLQPSNPSLFTYQPTKNITTTRYLSFILPTLLLIAACSNDEGDATVNNGRVPLRIASSITVEQSVTTRAANSAWEDADQIGIFCTTGGTTTTYTDHASTPTTCNNLLYTFNDGTNYETSGSDYRAFTGTTVYLPANGANIDVYAYYPYSAGATTPTAVPINVATANQTSQKAIDFMRAAVADRNTNDNTAELLFTHKLVKLQFNLKRGRDMLEHEIENATVSVKINNQPTAATYNIYDDAISITAGSNDITAVLMGTAATGYEKSFECIVLPNKMTALGDVLANNTLTNRTVTITIQYAGETQTFDYTFTIGNTTSLVSGNKYTYNVTVNGYSIVVNTTNTYTEQW